MIRVAITGGIGSGKSTVAKVFETLGVPVYYSDQRARALMDSELRDQIVELFGEDAYCDEGLNRAYISSLVFSDPTLLLRLNGVVHPAVISDFLNWSSAQDSPYVIIETALLLESGLDRVVDHLVVVTAPLELRLERVVARDSTTIEAVEARIKAQTSQERLIEIADTILDTQPHVMLIPQIVQLDRQLSKK